MVKNLIESQPLIKLVSLIAVALLIYFTYEQDSHVAALGLGHYLVGYFYSFQIMKRAASSNKKIGAFIFLFIFAFYSAEWQRDWVMWFFAIHHIMSETYNSLNIRFVRKGFCSSLNFLVVNRFILNILGFAAMTRFDTKLSPFIIGQTYVPGLFIFSIIIYIGLIYLNKNNFSKIELRDIFLFDLLTIALVRLTYIFPEMGITLIQVVIYHVFFWLLFPVAKMLKEDESKRIITKYLLLSFSSFGIFYGMVWYEQSIRNDILRVMFNTFTMIGLYHIITSIGLSTFNPVSISRFFGVVPRVTKEN
jgi:hypothetical protein